LVSFSIFLSWPRAEVQKLFGDMTCLKRIIYLNHVLAFSTTSFGLEMGWETSTAREFGREIIWSGEELIPSFSGTSVENCKACCIPE